MKRETLIPQDRMRIDYACILKGSVTLFGSEMKTYGVNENPQLFRLEDGTLMELAFFDRSIHNSICSDCKFADGGKGSSTMTKGSYFISTFRKQSVICSVDAEGNFETLYDRQGSVHTLSLGAGAVWYTAMRDMGLTEIYRLKDGKEKLTAFNDGLLAERDVCPVEDFTFTYIGTWS